MFDTSQCEKKIQEAPLTIKNMTQNSQNCSRLDRFAIKSTKVVLEDYESPQEAFILVEEEKILDICVVSQTSKEAVELIYKEWEVRDYKNSYVFPGVVDSNVHLHANFGAEWENITYATELAASGGVTTLIDNPIMSKPFTTSEEYLKSIQQRMRLIKINSKVDYGLYGLLEPRTEDSIEKMIELGVLGLKCYLMNCFQNTIGHYQPEKFQSLFTSLENKHPEILLLIHPEMATERELYQSSPCRTFSIEKRLDMGHKIQSLEFGGGAHKGSYVDDFAKKEESERGDENDDFDGATLDAQTRLKDRVNLTREKSEIEDLVYFEKASYYYEEKNGDSDEECSEAEFITYKSLEKEKESQEESKESPRSTKLEKKTAIGPASLREPLFAVSSVEEIEDSETPKVEGNFNEKTFEEKQNAIPKIELFQQKCLFPNDLQLNNNDFSLYEKDQRSTFDLSEGPCPKSANKEFLEGLVEKDGVTQLIFNRSSRKLSSLRTYSEDQLSLSPVRSEFSNNEEDDELPRRMPQLKMNLSLIDRSSMALDSSPRLKSAKSLSMSPIFKGSAPTSSSLLARRISRKSSFGMQVSTSSNLSSPGGDLTKVNLLNTSKVSVKNDQKYNQNYRIFLANRPLSWEDNAVSTILNCINSESKIRIMLQNLSLGKSFSKIYEKKETSTRFSNKLISDCSSSHLFFTDKMVKKGESKYKVSPPLRSLDNRSDLIESLRLGGIDIVSSYHFYVPPRFKIVDDGNFRRAFSGLDSIGCSLQATWTAMYCSQKQSNPEFEDQKEAVVHQIMKQLSQVMCLNPSKVLKIDHRKGSIAKNKDADFVIWDPFQIKQTCLNPNHVFSEKLLYGAVEKTYVRGHLIYNHQDVDQISRTFTSELIKAQKFEEKNF